MLVVGIDIRGAHNAPAVDQEPSRHRQGPAALTVANRQVIAKAKINPLEIIGQPEPKTDMHANYRAAAPRVSMPAVAPAPRSKTVDRDGGTDRQLLPGVRVFIDWVVRALGAGHG